MLVSSLVQEISYNLRGLDDAAPSEGSDEANYWLSLANQKKDDWAGDPNENWTSLFEERALVATIAAGDNTYNLDTDFIRLSDSVFVTVGTNQSEFTTTEPENRAKNSTSVYTSGKNPKVLNFNGQISATSIYAGGTITVPGYYLPDDMTAFTDTVPVDDPHWLAMAVASEVAFNDTSYEDKAPDLLAKANELYTSMRANNRKGTSTTPKTVQTQLKKIRGVA